MLPEGTLQHASVGAKIVDLDAQIAAAQNGGEQAGDTTKKQSFFRKRAAGLGSLLVVILSKAKLLLLGLTKFGAVLSMFASLGVYWALYGWKFGLGLVVSIYIHEMGHVQALKRYGIAASAPMFIPGFGAFIRMRATYLSAVQDSRVGLAGPLFGMGAATASLLIYFATGAKIWGAIASFGATINLFNLIPIWQLDGGRGFHSLAFSQRLGVMATALGLWYATSEPMLLLISLGCGYRLFTKDAAPEADVAGLRQFAGLLAGLAAIGVFSRGLFR